MSLYVELSGTMLHMDVNYFGIMPIFVVLCIFFYVGTVISQSSNFCNEIFYSQMFQIME